MPDIDKASARSATVTHRTSAGEGGRRGNEASRLRVVGSFFVVQTVFAQNWEAIALAEIEKELRHYLEGAVEPRAALEWSRETSAAMVELKFCDLLGTWQHVTLPIGSFDESAFDEGPGFAGSSSPARDGVGDG